MKPIQNNLKAIRRRIMLRVWYSYIISLVVSPVTAAGVIFGASFSLSLKLFSVSSIIHNLMEVRLGSVPDYLWQTLVSIVTRGEFLKLVSLILIVASLVYLRRLLRGVHFGTQNFARTI